MKSPAQTRTRPGRDSPEIRRLCERSDRRGWAQLGTHLALLTATTMLVALTRGTFFVWPAMALHGVLLAFLFAPLHECIHRTAFRSRAMNATVAWIAGCVLCLPPKYFRAFHLSHHRFTQQRERDPELGTPKPVNLRAWAWQVSGVPYWRESVAALLRHAAGRVDETFIGTGAKRQVVLEARVLLMVYTGVVLVSWWASTVLAVVYWVVPVVLGQPVLRLFLMAEHTACPTVPDMLANSRTTHTHPLVLKLGWNMSYHAEHHWHPGLPFHALAKAHELLADFVVVQERGYHRFHGKLLRSYRLAAGHGQAVSVVTRGDDRTG